MYCSSGRPFFLRFLGPFRVFYAMNLSLQISRFCVLMVMWCKSRVNNANLDLSCVVILDPSAASMAPCGTFCWTKGGFAPPGSRSSSALTQDVRGPLFGSSCLEQELSTSMHSVSVVSSTTMSGCVDRDDIMGRKGQGLGYVKLTVGQGNFAQPVELKILVRIVSV